MSRSPAAKMLARAPVTTRAMLDFFISSSSDALTFAMSQRSHQGAPVSLGLAGIRGVRLAPPRGRVRVPAPLRRRHALLRLVDRPGAPPAPAPGGHGQPLHAGPEAGGARVHARVPDTFGGNAGGGADQRPPGAR